MSLTSGLGQGVSKEGLVTELCIAGPHSTLRLCSSLVLSLSFCTLVWHCHNTRVGRAGEVILSDAWVVRATAHGYGYAVCRVREGGMACGLGGDGVCAGGVVCDLGP